MKTILSLFVLAVFVFAAQVQASYPYTTVDYPSSAKTKLTGMSGSIIAGAYQNSDFTGGGFLYDGSTWTPLTAPAGGTISLTAGKVLVSGSSVFGYYSDGSNNHGFVYDGTSCVKTEPDGSVASYVVGKSGSNYVGYSTNGGFTYDGTTFTALNPANSSFTTISAVSGNYVAGYYTSTIDSLKHFFLYDGTDFSVFDPVGGINSTPTVAGVNSNGQVIGKYYDSSWTTHKFMYDGTFHDLSYEPKAISNDYIIAQGSNNKSIDVYSVSSGALVEKDFIGTASMPMPAVAGIDGNNVYGSYYDSSWNAHGFVQTVPEPSTLVLLVSSVLGLVVYAWRRRTAA